MKQAQKKRGKDKKYVNYDRRRKTKTGKKSFALKFSLYAAK
jgi:hypothetical protein